MTISSSLLIGFVISLLSALTTAFTFSNEVKYFIASLGMLLTMIPLIINIKVFLESPFGRVKHLKNELYKLLLSDSYESFNIKWNLRGESVYCNQSMVPKSVLSPRKTYFLTILEKTNIYDVNDPLEINYDGLRFKKGLSDDIFPEGHMTEIKVLLFNNFYCNVKPDLFIRVFGNRFQNSIDGDKIIERDIGELIVSIIIRNSGPNKLMFLNLKHYSGVAEDIDITDFNPTQFFTLVYCVSIHSIFPESGVLSEAFSSRRGVEQYHTLSYQEIVDYIRFDIIEIKSRDSKHFICEGFDDSIISLFKFLPEKFDQKFGTENKFAFLYHHISFWGKPNFKALDFVMNRRNGHDYRIMGSNWKSKRYLTDVSYLLECIGKCRFSDIDKKIKPTVLARSCFSNASKFTDGIETHLFIKKDPELCKMDNEIMIKKLRDDKNNDSDKMNQELKYEIINNIKINKIMINKRGLVSKKSDRARNIKMVKDNSLMVNSTNDLTSSKLNHIKKLDCVVDDIKIATHKELKFYVDDLEIDEGKENDPIMKVVKTYKDSLISNLNVKQYEEDLNKSLFNWKRKTRIFNNFINYKEGEKHFPINPIKYSLNKFNDKVANSAKELGKFEEGKKVIRKRQKLSLCIAPISLKNTYESLEVLKEEDSLEEVKSKGVVIKPVYKKIPVSSKNKKKKKRDKEYLNMNGKFRKRKKPEFEHIVPDIPEETYEPLIKKFRVKEPIKSLPDKFGLDLIHKRSELTLLKAKFHIRNEKFKKAPMFNLNLPVVEEVKVLSESEIAKNEIARILSMENQEPPKLLEEKHYYEAEPTNSDKYYKDIVNILLNDEMASKKIKEYDCDPMDIVMLDDDYLHIPFESDSSFNTFANRVIINRYNVEKYIRLLHGK